MVSLDPIYTGFVENKQGSMLEMQGPSLIPSRKQEGQMRSVLTHQQLSMKANVE